ncbi:MAG: hypothetical protein ACJAVL_001417, partial [Bacteroidia bacterium]
MSKLTRKEFLKRSLIASAAIPLLSRIHGAEASPLLVPNELSLDT